MMLTGEACRSIRAQQIPDAYRLVENRVYWRGNYLSGRTRPTPEQSGGGQGAATGKTESRQRRHDLIEQTEQMTARIQVRQRATISVRLAQRPVMRRCRGPWLLGRALTSVAILAALDIPGMGGLNTKP